jgi:hypothetical protein
VAEKFHRGALMNFITKIPNKHDRNELLKDVFNLLHALSLNWDKSVSIKINEMPNGKYVGLEILN